VTAPNNTARANHDCSIPGHVSALAVTDPELIEVFDNAAFDEVLLPPAATEDHA
jgi:4-carboxymuconolactone decarboxylase